MGRSVTLGRLALLAALPLAVPAVAQESWHVRYQRGVALEMQGQWQEALTELEAAARQQPRPRKRIVTYAPTDVGEYDPHFHIARCLTELGRYPAAVVELRVAMRAGVTPRPRLDALRTRIEHEVAQRLATPAPAASLDGQVSVISDPAGASVTVDGAAAGSTPLDAFTVAAGDHVVRIEKRGYSAVEETVSVAAGGTYALDRSLRPVAAPARVPIAATATAVPPTPIPTATESAIAPPATAIASLPTPAPAPAPTRLRASRLFGAALAIAFVAAAVWWLARRRRRRDDPAHTPTRVIAATPTQVRSGQTLGAYELTGLLGRGGMATTYRATRPADGSEVALKVPHEGCFTDPTYRERFLREGRLGEQLHHPRIVRIFEAAEEDGRPFLAMELLAGRTLKQELRERGPLSVRRAMEIAADIAEALDYAHVKGVIHRDLKPENVMLLPDGSVKVMDFGIARLEGQEGLTSSQFFLGTPLYAAPEMIEPKRIDHRVDLYSLGIILFEMLQGTVPFSADSPFKVLQMHQSDPLPSRPALARPVPDRVWAVVERLCAKQPGERYQTAEALLVELHAQLRSLPREDLRD